MNARSWFLETRPQFLLLSVVLAFLGTTIAWNAGYFNFGFAVLAFIGLLLAHVSVNVLNDWFDFRSGIDKKTVRTPFSGGSGILPGKLMTTRQVFWLGMGAFIIIVPIGIYFLFASGWGLLVLRTRSPEWAAGLGLGMLPILGTFFVQASHYTVPALIASVPSGFLVYNLLLLNEFPDVEADKTAGRRTLPITEGRRRAGLIYSATTIAVYAWIVAAVALGKMPAFSLIALLTLPLAAKAIAGAQKSENLARLVPAMGSNVMVVLLTQLLLGIGYILDRVV
jgi:1,4-dihydroxy-2-naphthoate octaprenyltransferase